MARLILNGLTLMFDAVRGPAVKFPSTLIAESKVVAGAVKLTLAPPPNPMWIAGMGMSGNVKP